MKSEVFYGPVAMVALLARLAHAAQINTTSEDLKNIANIVHNRLDQSFIEENVDIFANANNEYEFCHVSNTNQPLANRRRRELSYTTPSSPIPNSPVISNFDLLLNSTNSTRDAEAKSKLYDDFYNTTKNGTHPDRIYRLIRLYTTVKSELSALKEVIIAQATEPISTAFVTGEKSSTALQLFNEISNADNHLLYTVYNAAIRNVTSQRVPVTRILINEKFLLNKLIEHMAVHEAIIDVLSGYQFFQEPKTELLPLARQMLVVQNNSAYKTTVHQFLRSRYENMTRIFPAMVRHIVFSSRVCIRNIANDKYLYVTDNVYEMRRYVYVGPVENKNFTSNHRWIIHFTSDSEFENVEVNIQNERFGEYLFPDQNEFYLGNRDSRIVFTHRSKRNSTDSVWGLVIDEGAVYMKGTYKGYLYADALKRKRNSVDDYVFTTEGDNRTENCKWEIVDCS